MPTNPRREGKGPFWFTSDLFLTESRSVLVVKRDVERTVAFHYDTPMKLNENIARETLSKFEFLMGERIDPPRPTVNNSNAICSTDAEFLYGRKLRNWVLSCLYNGIFHLRFTAS